MSQATEKEISIRATSFVIGSRTGNLHAEIHDQRFFSDRDVNVEVTLGGQAESDTSDRTRDINVTIEMRGRSANDEEFIRFASIHLTQQLVIGQESTTTVDFDARLFAVGWMIVRPILQDTIGKMGVDIQLPIELVANIA